MKRLFVFLSFRSIVNFKLRLSRMSGINDRPNAVCSEEVAIIGFSARVRKFAIEVFAELHGMVVLPDGIMVVVKERDQGFYIQITCSGGVGRVQNSLFFLNEEGEIYVYEDCKIGEAYAASREQMAELGLVIDKLDNTEPPVKHRPLRDFLQKLAG